jgi:isopentenyl phosphate kinase
VLLAGEVAGVYDSADMTGRVIVRLTPATVGHYVAALGGSHGTDVTGGMLSKVQQMLHLIRHQPNITVRIFSGAKPGAVRKLLSDPRYSTGTVIDHDD